MKPTDFGEQTIIHDPECFFGEHDMYVHVRTRLPTPGPGSVREWVATFDEVARMEGRAERGLNMLPQRKESIVVYALFYTLGFGFGLGFLIGYMAKGSLTLRALGL